MCINWIASKVRLFIIIFYILTILLFIIKKYKIFKIQHKTDIILVKNNEIKNK